MKNTRSFCFLAGEIILLAAFWLAQTSTAGTVSSLGVRWTPARSAQNIDWDENDKKRDERYQIDKGLDAVSIKPGMVVGEVGAGYGYLAFKLAARVGPNGKVYAEDIFGEMLETLKDRAAQRGFRNIETIVGTPVETLLPKGSLDMVFMHATIKFVDKPVELLNNIALSLKPEGRFIMIEMEDEKAVNLSGKPIPGEFRTRQGYLDLFAQTAFRVDRIDDASVRHHTVFILAVKRGTSLPTFLN